MNLFRLNSHRHQNEDMLKWFKALLKFQEFESRVELCTLTSLHSKKMLECFDGDNVDKTIQLRQKLQEHYNDNIFLSTLKGWSMW